MMCYTRHRDLILHDTLLHTPVYVGYRLANGKSKLNFVLLAGYHLIARKRVWLKQTFLTGLWGLVNMQCFIFFTYESRTGGKKLHFWSEWKFFHLLFENFLLTQTRRAYAKWLVNEFYWKTNCKFKEFQNSLNRLQNHVEHLHHLHSVCWNLLLGKATMQIGPADVSAFVTFG